MPFDTAYLIYGAIFFGALLLVEGVYFMILDNSPGRRKANRRMAMLASGKDSRDVYELLAHKKNVVSKSFLSMNWITGWLDNLIIPTGLLIKAKQMLSIMAALFCISLAAYLIAFGGSNWANTASTLFIAFLVATFAGVVLPVAYLRWKRSSRLKLFGEQLPDALDVMVRSLRAGHPISSAMGLVTTEMLDPIGTEFGIATDEMTYGLDLREALENLGNRVELEDFRYVVVAINIQHETGGNLAEVLASLASVIRDRFRLFRKVRALSGEGRVSAWILSFLPIITIGGIFISNPAFYLDVADDPIFIIGGIGSIALMFTGIFIMYRMVNFRV